MLIKQFKERQVRVMDPLRPGRRVFETRFSPTGAHSHAGFDAADDGWIEVPQEVGLEAIKFRSPDGARFFTPDQVEEEVAVGRLNQEDIDNPEPVRAAQGPKRTPAPAGKA